MVGEVYGVLRVKCVIFMKSSVDRLCHLRCSIKRALLGAERGVRGKDDARRACASFLSPLDLS